jgi:hypothetical protein
MVNIISALGGMITSTLKNTYHTENCECSKPAYCFIELNKVLFVDSDMNTDANNYDNRV